MSGKHLGKLNLTSNPESITEKAGIGTFNLRGVKNLLIYGNKTQEDIEMTNVSEDKLPPVPDLQMGYYKHFKGTVYQVACVARSADNVDAFYVIYGSQRGGEVWVREYNDFIGYVRGEKRFRYIPEHDLIPVMTYMDTPADRAAIGEQFIQFEMKEAEEEQKK
jgi:hypothetical protein